MTHEQRTRLVEIVKELQEIHRLKVISGDPATREAELFWQYDMLIGSSEGEFLTNDE